MKLKILYLTDIAVNPPKDRTYSKLLSEFEWQDDLKIINVLQSLGHHVQMLSVHNDIKPLLYEIEHYKPDLIFNQCEAFQDDRNAESNFVAMFNLLEIAHTGASAQALSLCKNKSITKAILKSHQITTPDFLLIAHNQSPKFKIEKPVIIKPVDQESSVGINTSSYCTNTNDALERVKFLQKKYSSDVLVEEFIHGREIYVGFLGDQIFPFRELFFDHIPDSKPKFATFKTKWDDDYRLHRGIRNGAALPLSKNINSQIKNLVKEINLLFQIDGYARLDLRIQNDKAYVIEINPNPSLGEEDDFAMSALQAGISYEKLIQKIILQALNRRANSTKPKLLQNKNLTQ